MSIFDQLFGNPLKTVHYTVDNIDNVWEKIVEVLSREEGLTQGGVDLPTKRISYLYHPDYYTIDKLTKKIQSLGARISNIKED